MIEPVNCKCGAKARVRSKGEYAWVECSSKKCNMQSGFVHFIKDSKFNMKELCMEEAITLWNRMIKKSNIVP